MPLRLALIGTGGIAGTYLNAAAHVDDVAVHAIISRDAARARRVADEHQVPHAATDLESIAEHVDAVVSAGPNGLHPEHARAAAAIGKHALLEKPLCIDPADGEAAISACSQAGTVLAVTYQRRTRPTNRAIKELLDSGALGRVLAVDLQLKFYRGDDYYASGAWRGTWDEDGGGPFIQQASHDLDLLCWLVGEPHQIQAHCATLAHPEIEVEDHGAAIGRLEHGGIVSIVASTICKPGFSPRMDIITERGSLSLANDAITAWHIDGVDQPEVTQPGSEGHDAATSATVSDTSAHEAVLTDFARACRDGSAPICSGQDALAANRLITAIYRAAGIGPAAG